jgi:RNA polymerase sigma-70 factor (ECF subfamily)
MASAMVAGALVERFLGATIDTDWRATVVGTVEDFDEFFRREHPRLLRVLSAADASASHALQEAFVRAARSWSRVGRYDDPAGWVRRVAINRILNERRSMRRRGAAVERLHAAREEDRVDLDATADLAVALDRLPRQQRMALTLFYLGGLTSAEVGAAMGVDAGTVRSHVHDARARLRVLLEVHDE